MADDNSADLTTLTVQLLSAYVSNNQVPSGELAGLIQSTRAALAPEAAPAAAPEIEHQPAVTVRKSLASRDHIISLIDGKPYKSLKRHLSSHGLSPAEYRARYKLAKEYPMVAPGYSERRREVAKRLGLGRKPAVSASAPVEAETPSLAPETKAEAPASVPAKAPRRKLKIASGQADAAAVKPARARAKQSTKAEQSSEAPAASSEATAAPKVSRGRKPAAGKATPSTSAAEPKPRRGRKPKAEAASDAG